MQKEASLENSKVASSIMADGDSHPVWLPASACVGNNAWWWWIMDNNKVKKVSLLANS